MSGAEAKHQLSIPESSNRTPRATEEEFKMISPPLIWVSSASAHGTALGQF